MAGSSPPLNGSRILCSEAVTCLTFTTVKHLTISRRSSLTGGIAPTLRRTQGGTVIAHWNHDSRTLPVRRSQKDEESDGARDSNVARFAAPRPAVNSQNVFVTDWQTLLATNSIGHLC